MNSKCFKVWLVSETPGGRPVPDGPGRPGLSRRVGSFEVIANLHFESQPDAAAAWLQLAEAMAFKELCTCKLHLSQAGGFLEKL